VKKAVIILCYFLLVAFIQEKAGEEWHLKKYEQGISVYTRHAEHSKLKELRSDFQVKTSLSSIVALLNDFESYPDWVYHCEKSYAALKISDKEFIQYQSVKAPWPVENRDIVIHKKFTQDPITKVVIQRINGMPDYLPNVAGHIRVKVFKATWIITPLKGGMVNLEYQLLVDPSGSLPLWLVNLAVVDGPFDTEVNMKEMLMKEKYRNAKVAYIKEP
jgi:ribosome-associated toxin RatA of RatAB toxin-antitoxin module